MKGFAKIFILTLIIAGIAGCDRRSCKDVACPFGQSCFQGACYCADGYEGADCATPAIQKFISPSSNYFVNVSCNGIPPFGTSSYYASMYAGASPSEVRITNMLGGICSEVVGYIRTDRSNNGNIIEINEQSCGGTIISGQGTWNGINRQIVFDLYINSNGTYQCQHIFYQQ